MSLLTGELLVSSHVFGLVYFFMVSRAMVESLGWTKPRHFYVEVNFGNCVKLILKSRCPIKLKNVDKIRSENFLWLDTVVGLLEIWDLSKALN